MRVNDGVIMNAKQISFGKRTKAHEALERRRVVTASSSRQQQRSAPLLEHCLRRPAPIPTETSYNFTK